MRDRDWYIPLPPVPMDECLNCAAECAGPFCAECRADGYTLPCLRCCGDRIDPDGKVCTRCCGSGNDPANDDRRVA